MSESATNNKRKAKDKAYYIKSAKQAKRSAGELGPGMKGFLCTSNREKESVREAYNVFIFALFYSAVINRIIICSHFYSFWMSMLTSSMGLKLRQ